MWQEEHREHCEFPEQFSLLNLQLRAKLQILEVVDSENLGQYLRCYISG